MGFLRRFLSDQSGMSAVEYGLVLCLLSLGLLGAFSGTGVKLGALFGEVADALG
jgi:Flp pilus assembly pilin Flp